MRVRYIFLVLFFLIPFISEAQLTAPGMTTVRYSSYPSAPGIKDPVFIYCNPGGTQKGTLRAASPGGSGPYNFSWYRWNNTTKSFSDFILTENGVNSSVITNLDEGGYRVMITGGYTTTLTGWIFLDKPNSSAKLQNRTCDYVALKGTAAIDTFYYHDPATGSSIKLPDAVKFLWSSDPQSVIPFPDFDLEPRTFTPPLVDVTYQLQVSDSFGCVSTSSFFYESIHVKAEFSADPVKGEAPLEVTFTDKSIRGNYSYRWNFGEKKPDGTKVPDWVVTKDSLWIFSSPFTHKYYIPGEYSPIVTIESNLHCIDSFRLAEKIVVDPSSLDVPNVFTPDGDGINDYFRVEAKSLKWLSMEIFSRSGTRVYYIVADGESLHQWKGWDGNVNGSSAKASPGVYFYIIKAQGWDDVNRDAKGFFYLYR